MATRSAEASRSHRRDGEVNGYDVWPRSMRLRDAWRGKRKHHNDYEQQR